MDEVKEGIYTASILMLRGLVLLLLSFIIAVLSHGIALLTGGLIAFGLAIWERWQGQISRTRYIVILGFTVFAACYFTWLDEHQERVTAECRISLYKNAASGRTKFILRHLREIYSANQNFMDAKVSKDNLNTWMLEVDGFRAQSINWIKTNMGPTASAKVLEFREGETFSNNIGVEHNNYLNLLYNFGRGLSVLTDSPAKWDEFLPVIQDDCR